MIFKKAENTQAYLKAGLMGFAGDGKTFTATQIAIGMVQLMRERKLPGGDKPVMFLDTETGSAWVEPMFGAAGIELFTAQTRAFRDLVPAVKEAEASGSLLIIDSISHFWREIMESYAKKKNRRQGLQFQDWAFLKAKWGEFTDAFVNSQAHIIMCGRAGYEYDFFEQEGGKKELTKTGVKMKAETETGYEPSILILMEKHSDKESKKIIHRTATVLKDRANVIDGKEFINPTFEDFRPHIDFLNLGGVQVGVDTSRDSTGMIPENGKTDWQRDKDEKAIVLDEIQTLIVKHYPGASASEKAAKADLIEKHFSQRSWKRIETFDLTTLQNGYNAIHLELEGVPAKWEGPNPLDEELPAIPS